MAKITGGLFSESVSGNVGGMLVYSTSKGVQTVKGNRLKLDSIYHFRKKPVSSQTLSQLSIRDTFRKGIKAWNNLSVAGKQVYKDAAKKVKNTALGVFMKDFIDEFHNEALYRINWLWSVGAGQPLYMMDNSDSIGALMGVAMDK
ncbi:MAG: hypothetical protein V3W20_05630 [Candidatus Neomarinimicrobiota bacterium]